MQMDAVSLPYEAAEILNRKYFDSLLPSRLGCTSHLSRAAKVDLVMKKPLIGILVGGFLGIFDGWSALWTAGDDPAVRADIAIIVAMGVLKGVIAGVAAGLMARKLRSVLLGMAFGATVGLLLALPIVLMQGKYYWQIMLPGATVGLLVGLATQKYGGRKTTAAS